MDLRYTDAELAFRDEVRQFFTETYPQDILERRRRGQTLGKEELQRSEKALAAQGWSAVNWPVEHGGTGWNQTRKYLFDAELEQAGAPSVVPMGLLYVAPVIYTFGTEEQKRRFLPDILESNIFWAQGYSEPEAGSDLASLQCRAVPDGDHYRVTGTKIWTSQAHFADWIFCLVRTSDEDRPQKGITFLTIDMNSPGVQVDPIITIDGGHHLNTVTFDDVRVPVENRIGGEGEGWSQAKYLLTHERTSYAHIAGKKEQMRTLRGIMEQPGAHGPPLIDDPDFRRRFDHLMVELTTLEYTTLRTLAAVATGGAPGSESSILKIRATEVAQAITELYLEAAGYCGLRRVADRSAADWNGGAEGEFAPAWTVTGVADRGSADPFVRALALGMRSHQGAFPQAYRGYVKGTQRRGGRIPSAPQGGRLRPHGCVAPLAKAASLPCATRLALRPQPPAERGRMDQRFPHFTRAQSIYGGTNEIQKNLVARQVLGL